AIAIHETVERHLQLHDELSAYCRRMARLKAYEYSISLLRPHNKAECVRHLRGMIAVDAGAAVRFVGWDFSRRLWRATKRAVQFSRKPDPLYTALSEDDLRAWPDHRLDDLYFSLSQGW